MSVSLGSEVPTHPGLAADVALQLHTFQRERRHHALALRQIERLDFVHITAR